MCETLFWRLELGLCPSHSTSTYICGVIIAQNVYGGTCCFLKKKNCIWKIQVNPTRPNPTQPIGKWLVFFTWTRFDPQPNWQKLNLTQPDHLPHLSVAELDHLDGVNIVTLFCCLFLSLAIKYFIQEKKKKTLEDALF